MPERRERSREPLVLISAGLIGLLISGIGPRDRFTWCLEVAPVVVGAALLIGTYRRFPLTPLLYRLLFLHAVVLLVGGHYTYEQVPIGLWARDAFGLARNHYDRLGHFAQGFVPAILVREILVRRSPLKGSRWLGVLVVSVCLAFSALFEMFEWWTAVAVGQSADMYLATQGDVWDTQWDMFLAMTGALSALVVLGRLHDTQLRKLKEDPPG